MDFDRYLGFLEERLTPARLAHSLGVMQVMGDLAPVYGLDREPAMAAGLLHDAAKDLTPEQQDAYTAAVGIEFHHPCERDYVLYLHGPVSRFRVRTELGVTDPLILGAIDTHCWQSGVYFDHPLSWCLRFADLIEPNRDWSRIRWLVRGGVVLREAAYGGRLAEAALLHAGLLVRWFPEQGLPLHPNMSRVYAGRLAELAWEAARIDALAVP